MAIRNEPVVIKQSVLFLMSAGLIAGSLASARSETPSNYDKSGVPSALQSATPDNSPVVVLPEAKAPETGGAAASETTDHAAKRAAGSRERQLGSASGHCSHHSALSQPSHSALRWGLHAGPAPRRAAKPLRQIAVRAQYAGTNRESRNEERGPMEPRRDGKCVVLLAQRI